MGGFRSGGMQMNMRAERSPHGRGARAGQADSPKKKPNLKKVWPQIHALIAPRVGLLTAGIGMDHREPCGRPGFTLSLKAVAG